MVNARKPDPKTVASPPHEVEDLAEHARLKATGGVPEPLAQTDALEAAEETEDSSSSREG